MYFINETKKQVVSSKKLYADFEQKQQLLCYLNFCQGDVFRTEFESSQWIEDYLYNSLYDNYKYIKLYEYKINIDDCLYDNPEVERLLETIMS